MTRVGAAAESAQPGVGGTLLGVCAGSRGEASATARFPGWTSLRALSVSIGNPAYTPLITFWVPHGRLLAASVGQRLAHAQQVQAEPVTFVQRAGARIARKHRQRQPAATMLAGVGLGVRQQRTGQAAALEPG